MGFDAGLYVYPKYEDVNYKDLTNIEIMLEYYNNKWAQEHFNTADEYAQYILEENYLIQSIDRLDFYYKNLTADEFGYNHVWRDYGYWCSNGIPLHEDVLSKLGEPVSDDDKYSSKRILSKKDIVELMNYCLVKILEHAPQPAIITHAFRYQRDEDGMVSDDADITLFKIDGFEVDFEDDEGNSEIKRIETNPEWECLYGFPKKDIDDWTFNGYIIGLQSAAKILGEVDFDKNIVVYSGGW